MPLQHNIYNTILCHTTEGGSRVENSEYKCKTKQMSYNIKTRLYTVVQTNICHKGRSHLTMHRTIGLTDYYRTTSDGLTG